VYVREWHAKPVVFEDAPCRCGSVAGQNSELNEDIRLLSQSVKRKSLSILPAIELHLAQDLVGSSF